MSTRPAPRTRVGEEIWETTTDGRVWLPITDEFGKERMVSVGGKAGSRLRIKTIDREVAQDRVNGDDPFVCGMLVRVDADQQDDARTVTTQALTTDALLRGFTKSGNAFHAFVDGLNEMNVRRMRDVADLIEVTTSQVTYLDKVIKEKYRREGDTPTYREMLAVGDVYGYRRSTTS